MLPLLWWVEQLYTSPPSRGVQAIETFAGTCKPGSAGSHPAFMQSEYAPH